MLLTQFHQATLYLVTAHVLDGVKVICFTPVYGQSTQSRTRFLGVDGRRELVVVLGPQRELAKPFELAHQRNAKPPLAIFPELVDVLGDVGE